MIKAKQAFFWTSNLEGHGFHGNKAPFAIWAQNIIHCLCSLKNFILLKSVQYIKSFGHFNVRCWKLWIKIFSTEKTL